MWLCWCDLIGCFTNHRVPYLPSSLIKCLASYSDQNGNLVINMSKLTGHKPWCVDQQGVVLINMFLPFRYVAAPGYGISCISWRSWISREARDPSLLVNSTDGSLRLYRYVVMVTSLFSISCQDILGYYRMEIYTWKGSFWYLIMDTISEVLFVHWCHSYKEPV